MAWPTGTIDTTDMDAGTDNPANARLDIKDMADKVNLMVPARGAASGVASLDSSTKVPISELYIATDAEAKAMTSAVKILTPDNLDAVIGRGALVYRSTAESLATGVGEIINWDAENYDTDTIHDLVTNPSRLTVPSGVTKIKLTGQITFSTSSSGNRQVYMRKNGSDNFIGNPAMIIEGSPASPVETRINIASPILTVVATDYFELFAYQNSGGALNVESSYKSWFAMEIIK